jgi:hypothetical protein
LQNHQKPLNIENVKEKNKMRRNMRSFGMLVTLVTIVFFSAVNGLMAQDWEYSQHIAVNTKAEMRGLTLDSDTNLYAITFHKDAATVTGPQGTFVSPHVNNQDILVMKLQPGGDTLWTRSIAGGQSDYPRQIELDDNDDPFVTGIYRRSALSIQGTLLPNPQTERPTDPGYDIFLSQYSSDGGDVFAKRVAWGPLDDVVDKIAVDDANNVYMVGTYYDTLAFGPDTLFTPNPTDKYIFLAKFKPNGDFRWAKSISLTSTTGNFLDIVIDDFNQIYLSGFFTGDLNYDGTIVSSQGAAEDIVLAKIDTAGTLQWMISEGSDGLADRANGLTTDPSGSVYVTGYFSGTADFSGTPLTSAGSFDMFLAKYNTSGTLLWVTRNGDIGADIAYGAKVRENLLQTSGYFAGTVIFGNDTLKSVSTGDQNTGFFVYDTDGNPITANDIKTNDVVADDRGEYIEYDLAGNTYVGGYFEADSLFIGNDTLIRTASTHDAFLAKYQNPFSATFSRSTNISCNGGNNGELLVTTYFGTFPYTYEWSPNVIVYDDSSATELPAGDYWVKVTDATGDTVRISTTLTEPAPISITIDSTNITCSDSSNGTITPSATGGTGTLDFSWNGGNSIPGQQNQSDLQPDLYTLTVTDENSCAVIREVTLTAPSPIVFSGSLVVNESAIGAEDGSIDLNVSGGTPGYTYSWEDISGTMPGRVNDTLNNLAQGNYTARVVDNNLCQQDTVIYVPGELLSVDLINLSDVSCYGNNDGIAVARIVSGDQGEPYTFTFRNSLGTTIIPVNDTVVENLSTDWYYVTVNETGGELRSAIDSVFISQPDTLQIILTADTIDCFGDNNGSVTLLRTGGTGPFDFDWSNGATTQSITSVAAGWYEVTVTDANGCTATDSAEVLQNAEVVVNIGVAKLISCNGDSDGTLQASVSGGTGTAYTYAWDDPGSQSEFRAINLRAGTYSVLVTDSLGCQGNDTYIFTEPDVLTASHVDSSNITCRGNSDGRIAVSMSGGTQPYQYDWSPFILPDTNVVEDLGPATYPLTVTDSNGCTYNELTVTIEQPALALSIVEDGAVHIDNACFGDAEGSLTVIAAGGWENRYDYSIDAINWQSSPTFTALAAQVYTVSVRDSNSCIESVGIDITEAPEIQITGESVVDNTIIVQASGGTGTLYFYLDGSGTPVEDLGQFTGLEDGTYFVEITDDNNCGPVRSNDLTVNTTHINEAINAVTSIYPNPSNGLFNLAFELPDNGEFIVEVFSLNGAKVYQEFFFAQAKENKLVTIDLSSFEKGIYLVKINGLALNTKLIVE